MSAEEKYNPAEKFGGPAFEGSVKLSEMIENGTLEVDRGEIQFPEGIDPKASNNPNTKGPKKSSAR